jgi:hypothetical protein
MKAIAHLFALLPFAVTTVAAASGGEAEVTQTHPIELALWNPVQTSDERVAINGLRLNLPYGVNREIRGLDLGIAGRTNGDFYGVGLGGGGYVLGDVRGAQLNLVLSISKGAVLGMQHGIYSSAGSVQGVQSGIVNRVENPSQGARFGAVNVSESGMRGAEFGVVNHARRVNGLQLGLVNVASELDGVQIGLLNFAKNGFLPFFPVVNSAL